MSEPTPRIDATTPAVAWRPSKRALLIAGIAFAVGLLLFLGLWMRDHNNDFYRAQAPVQNVEGQRFEPLPAPLPAGDAENASGMGAQPDDTGAPPRIVEMPPTPLPPPSAAFPAPPPPEPVAMAPGDSPVPIQSPAPRYPPDALRRGESGTVLVRVHVGPDGIPVAVDLVRSSRSRALDRAATEAVRGWRFRPAQRDGQAVNGVVQVPISFNAGG
ncbi:MAG TPA: energy transducer TonB [Luteimonas sp.]|nr:energy transducer TonB [Luteimonas sp.]